LIGGVAVANLMSPTFVKPESQKLYRKVECYDEFLQRASYGMDKTFRMMDSLVILLPKRSLPRSKQPELKRFYKQQN